MTIKIWLLTIGDLKLIGWMAVGGVIKQATNQTIKAELRQPIKLAGDRFSNMTEAYADQQQKLKSIKRSNDNQCVLAQGGYCNYMYSK